MAKKEIFFDFYQLAITSINDTTLEECFTNIQTGNCDSCSEVKGFTREIYKLDLRRRGIWYGQFRKYRMDQLPAYARFGEDETEIQLDEGEGLIERNCFMYHRDRNILIWQHDSHANHPERFADFLSIVTGHKIEALPILTKSALKKLMSGKTEALKFHISVARPTAPSLYNENKFTEELFSLMDNSGSDLFTLTGGVDLRSKNSGTLNNNLLKKALKTLVSSGAAKNAKVLVIQDNQREWLDLISDRVKTSRQVEADKKSIPFLTMIDMVESAYDEKVEVLNETLGTPQNTLR